MLLLIAAFRAIEPLMFSCFHCWLISLEKRNSDHDRISQKTAVSIIEIILSFLIHSPVSGICYYEFPSLPGARLRASGFLLLKPSLQLKTFDIKTIFMCVQEWREQSRR